jgi:hypothetical protein
LVTQDRDLKLRLSPRALGRPEQADDAAQEEIQERLEHGAALLQTATPASWWDVIGFSYPTGQPIGDFEPFTSRGLDSPNQAGL